MKDPLPFVAVRQLYAYFKIAKNDYYPRHVCRSVRLSALNNSAHTGLIFITLDRWIIFGKSAGKIQVSLMLNMNKGYFMI